MKKLQEAAKLLNANAPVDGPLGKERIVYVNPLEEKILKALGGSGEIIIPEEGTPSYSQINTPKQTRILPEGYKGITSHRVEAPPQASKNRNWWEEFKDDVLGFDDTKWLGIKKHTFVGKGLKKIGDDILGIDGTKTLGIKDSTIGDVAKFVAPFFGPLGWAAWAGMNAYEINEALENANKYQNSLADFGANFTNNYDPRNFIGLRYGGLDGLVDYLGQGSSKNSTGIPKTTPQERAEKRGDSAMQAIKNRINSVPSYSLFNESGARQWGEDGSATNTAIAVDMQSKGKAPMFDVNDASKTTSLFASPGDPDYQPGFSIGGQYNDPYPNYMRPAGDQVINTINEVGTFLPDYGGTADQRMYDYQPIMDRLKGMNLDAINTVGQIYDKDGGIETVFKGFNQQQDDLSEQLKQLNTMTGYDNQRNLDSYINSLQGIGNAYGNEAYAFGQSANALRDYGNARANSVRGQVDMTNRAFDAERGRALAQNRQGLNLANQGLRNLNSLSATGTGASMANAMIGARLGQEMAGNIANVEADRYQRLAQINPALADELRAEQYAFAADKDIGGAQGFVKQATQDAMAAETRFNQGNQVNKAVASNIGIDKGMVDADAQLINDITNTRLQNVSMIPYIGQQAVQLPNLQIEAGLSPINPLMQYSAPFSQMGSMPSPVNTYQPQPATQPGMKWYDYAMMAPRVIGGVNNAIDEFGNFVKRF